ALDFEVPLVPLNDDRWRDVYVLELFHGPTLSFKDFGARTMARLMGHFLKQQDRYLTVLVATSGDTGSAVADGFAGQPNIRVVLLYPHGQVSPTQERQLIVKRPGVTALAVDGSFDDCQRLVKDAFHDPGLETVELSSANSINIGRLLPQMLYYMEALRKGQFEPAFCVPSGNLGNLTGGLLARLSGLPVRRFIAAHNANDFFPCHLSEGLNSYRASVRTLSNAMDVGVPSNFERIRALLSPEEMRGMSKGYSISDEETIAGMRRVFEETGYLPDPHTAVGLVAAERYRRRSGDTSPVVVLSTAHPAKFPEVVDRALGFVPEAPPVLARLWKQDTSVTRIPPEASMLRDVILSSDVDTRLRN
ncbi:MAG: threonine synthase, partial [Bacteroidota bacterium]